MNTTIGLNSCCHYELSNIKKYDDRIYFPYYYLEDYFIDVFDYLEIEYDINDDTVSVDASDISWGNLYAIKTESYSACVWYPLLKKYTYNSVLLDIYTLDDIPIVLKNISFPKFVKLDSVSCKDIHNGIFYSKEEVYDVFKKSKRITNTLENEPFSKKNHCLFVRDIDANIRKSLEVRCIVYSSKLVAVSSLIELSIEQKNNLENIITEIVLDIPYRDSILDLAIFKDNIKLIEVNNFGADSPTGAGLFNWKEDYFILYGGFSKVEYRYGNY
jgi:hypothetical protein